jgi:hypothetical protein
MCRRRRRQQQQQQQQQLPLWPLQSPLQRLRKLRRRQPQKWTCVEAKKPFPPEASPAWNPRPSAGPLPLIGQPAS